MSVVFDENYYKKVIRKFGYDPLRFGAITFGLGSIKPRELRARWLCHSGADEFAKSLGKDAIVSTGIGLSGPPHVGTLIQILNAIFLQKKGIPIQFVLGDLDAYNGKNIPLHTVKTLAAKYRRFILSLGFKNKGGSILRDQFSYPSVLRTMYIIGKYASDENFDNKEEDLHSFYVSRGKVDAAMTYRRKLSLNLMTADFIDLIYNNHYTHVLVMLGIDEHKYVLFAQEILSHLLEDNNLNHGHISAIYSPMNKGFNGFPKMSKSFPSSSINAIMSRDQIIKRVMGEEGIFNSPEESPVYQMMCSAGEFSTKELERLYNSCLKGGAEWAGVKKEYAKMLIGFFEKWPKE